jgi:hypothetical protein
MSAPSKNGTASLELVSEIGGKLADAMNTLAHLSRLLRDDQAIVLPPRRRAIQAVPAALPTRTRYTPPVTPETPLRRTRRQGAADRIVAAVMRPTGVLASELQSIAGYPCGPTVLDRLALTHGFTWYETGAGAKRRYIANRTPPRRSPPPASTTRAYR